MILDFFSIQNIVFSILGYDMSWIELLGTGFGLWAVLLSTQEKVSSWYIGILNVLLFFYLFYQIQLYSDMLLQIYFLLTNLIGWYQWTHPISGNENRDKQLKISCLSQEEKIIYSLMIAVGTLLLGFWMSQIHLHFPDFFTKPASFPYLDTFVLVASVIAQFLLTKKKVEAWQLWIAVDVVASIIYFQKGVFLMSIEYVVFCGIAWLGYRNWSKNAVF